MRLAATLLLYVALSLGFQRATPPLEASDEARHFGYVVWLQGHGALPVADTRRPGLAAQEAAQPPLYYLLGSALVHGLDTSDAPAFFVARPESPIGRADLPGRRDMFFRPPQPTGGRTPLAIALLRLFSMALGLATIVATYATAREIVPGSRAAAGFAAAVVAFNPMFLFISNSVNNDNLVTATAAAFVWATSRRAVALASPGAAAAMGAWIAVATLAKPSGLILLPLAFYRIAAARPGWRRGAVAGAVLCAAFLAVAGWWFARNLLLYGEPLAFDVAAALAGNLRRVWQPLALIREWDGFLKSFWGVFGAFNVIYPDAVYDAFFALTALGAASIARLLARSARRRDVRVRGLALLVIANLAAVALWTSRLLGSQGRLMFPSLPAIAVLAAASLETWPRSPRRTALVAVPAFLAASAAWAAWSLIPAAYGAP